MARIKEMGLNILLSSYRYFCSLYAPAVDGRYLDPQVPLSKHVCHSRYMDYLVEVGNKEGVKILEVGSREVTGRSDARKRFDRAEYIGFDLYPGPNVDVVGDAHELSQYFRGEQFDIIFSSAVFEHFAMPWQVSHQISKLLKVGGLVFVETHYSFSSHERPWHFFQFSDMALKVLFSPVLGFECIEAGVSNPIVGRFSHFADNYLKYKPVKGLYCHSEFLGRKVREADKFNWDNVNVCDVAGSTEYPRPQ